MFTQHPLVTVFLATYNRAAYLPTTLASVLSQSEHRFELLIMDDGSTDESPKILASIAAADPRVKVYSWKNRGVIAARNFLVEQAAGRFLAQIDSDDVWRPDHLELSLKALKENKETLACFCQPRIIGADGQALAVENADRLPPFLPPMPPEKMAGRLLCGNGLCAPTAVIRRTAFCPSEPFAMQYPFLHDYELWLRLLCRGPLLIRPASTVAYRWHASNMSGSANGSVAEELALVKKFLPVVALRYALPDLVVGQAMGHLALLSRMLGRDDDSINFLLKKHAIASLDSIDSCELILSLYRCSQGHTASAVLDALSGLATTVPSAHPIQFFAS